MNNDGGATQIKLAVLVDSQDQERGTMEIVAAHTLPGYLHRASSVFLLRWHGDELEVLIQKRSPHKFTCPLEWANTCCGNVRPAESYLACAQRRLKDELGVIGVELTEVDKFEYRALCNDNFVEHEMDTVFLGWFDGEVKPNPQEVVQTRWVPVAELSELVNNPRDAMRWVPWLPIVIGERKVIERIDKFA
jgi:isopentenyl-diphosphate Delta-isomerase